MKKEVKKKCPPVFGTVDTELLIEHWRVPMDRVDMFVDGWVQGKRNESFGMTRHWRSKPNDPSWNYGYELARAKKLYFTQALHSFLLSKEATE